MPSLTYCVAAFWLTNGSIAIDSIPLVRFCVWRWTRNKMPAISVTRRTMAPDAIHVRGCCFTASQRLDEAGTVRRVIKRRAQLSDGGVVIEVDEFARPKLRAKLLAGDDVPRSLEKKAEQADGLVLQRNAFAVGSS